MFNSMMNPKIFFGRKRFITKQARHLTTTSYLGQFGSGFELFAIA
jgi:hypothetical protein